MNSKGGLRCESNLIKVVTFSPFSWSLFTHSKVSHWQFRAQMMANMGGILN